jgi:hypothetical protein
MQFAQVEQQMKKSNDELSSLVSLEGARATALTMSARRLSLMADRAADGRQRRLEP